MRTQTAAHSINGRRLIWAQMNQCQIASCGRLSTKRNLRTDDFAFSSPRQRRKGRHKRGLAETALASDGSGWTMRAAADRHSISPLRLDGYLPLIQTVIERRLLACGSPRFGSSGCNAPLSHPTTWLGYGLCDERAHLMMPYHFCDGMPRCLQKTNVRTKLCLACLPRPFRPGPRRTVTDTGRAARQSRFDGPLLNAARCPHASSCCCGASQCRKLGKIAFVSRLACLRPAAPIGIHV